MGGLHNGPLFWDTTYHIRTNARVKGLVSMGAVSTSLFSVSQETLNPKPQTLNPKPDFMLQAARSSTNPQTGLPFRKLTWKPKKGPIKTTDPLKGGLYGFPC